MHKPQCTKFYLYQIASKPHILEGADIAFIRATGGKDDVSDP